MRVGLPQGRSKERQKPDMFHSGQLVGLATGSGIGNIPVQLLDLESQNTPGCLGMALQALAPTGVNPGLATYIFYFGPWKQVGLTLIIGPLVGVARPLSIFMAH